MSETQPARDTPRHEPPQSQIGSEPHLPAPLRFLYHHEISTAMLLLFALSLIGQSITGYREQLAGASASLAHYAQYLTSNEFLETVAENWEGEFLAIAAYVFFTARLHERGAKESRKPNPPSQEKSDVVQSPEAARRRKNAPWPLKVHGRFGGAVRWVYLHSILLTFLLLFLLTVAVHATMGLGPYNDALRTQHQPPVSVFGYMASNTFWLQSTRNWEAGFLSIAMLAVFSIFLRERGSPVSKVPDQPDEATAEEDERES